MVGCWKLFNVPGKLGIVDSLPGGEIFFHACSGPRYSSALVPVQDVPNPNPNTNTNPNPYPNPKPNKYPDIIRIEHFVRHKCGPYRKRNWHRMTNNAVKIMRSTTRFLPTVNTCNIQCIMNPYKWKIQQIHIFRVQAPKVYSGASILPGRNLVGRFRR